jgi:hypothetical protein
MRHLTISIVFVLSALLSAAASAQQVVSTYSTGAPGDPFKSPKQVALDKSGNLFVSDTGNHRVQRIDSQTGAVTTVAGTGAAGSSGDGGPATLALLGCPVGLAFDSLGNLYIADQCQNAVRKVTPGADQAVTGAADEIITTFAGNGTTGTCPPTDGVPASQTSVASPYQIAVDRADNVFILGTAFVNGLACKDLIRRVDAASGLISTTTYLLFGIGNNAMVFDNTGSLLFSANAVQRCAPVSGNLLTGQENCSAVLYGETDPLPLAVDQTGNLYFLDDPCDPGCLAIFKATPGPDGTLASGGFVPYAGNGSGYTGDGGPPLDATFSNPRGLAIDSAGNLFIADTGNNVIRVVSSGPTPPSLTGFPANPSKQSSATFSFTADASIASFECTLDHVTSPCTSPVTYQNLADGSHTFSMLGRSSSGTPSNAISYSWVVDTVPPPVPSIDSHPSDPSATAFASFTFTESEAGARVTCSLDGLATSCSSPTLYSGLQDGSHVFSVFATDAAGNNSAPNAFTWAIHTAIPPAPHIDSAPPALTNNKVSSIAFSDSQNGVSFLCQLDGQGSTSCVSPITFVGLPDGAHTFSVVASDATSGRSSAPAAYTWTVDTTPPKVGISGAPGIVTIPAPSQFSFTGGSSDVVGYLCSLDGAAFAPCTSPFNQSVTTQGTHTFAVEAVDAAGNVGPADSATWSVTYCRCTLFGNYTNPAFNEGEFVQSSPDGRFSVSAVSGASQQTNVSLIRTSDGAVVYSFNVPALYTAGWQFSPDSTRFWYLTGPAYTNFGSFPVTVLDLTTPSPKPMLTFSLGSATSAILQYSPSGAYLMTAEITSAGGTAISVYRVAGVSQGVLVHSTELSVALYGPETDGAVASWGFNQSAFGEPEAAFMYAWNAGQNLFNWNVVNLATGKQVISQSSTAISAYWQFNPCGNIIAFVNQSSLNGEQVDLFSVDDGVHIGETSFPLQAVTLTSQPAGKDSTVFQEVATISNPQQTIVITNDPTCQPNTPTGVNGSVAPIAPHSNTSPVTVTFSSVGQAGGTGVSTGSTGNAPPAGFELGNPPVYYDVVTSASYSGTIVLCVNYAGITFSGAPRLFHYVNGAWVDVTLSVDTAHQTICGTVTSLSPFAIFSTPSTPPDTTPPVVRAPANITVPATEAGGARGSAWPALAAFLAGATATDLVDSSPTQLPPQVAGANVDDSTLFACGTTQVTFRFKDASGNVGSATASVTVVVGSPKISGQVVQRGTLADGSTFIDLQLTNTGTGNARKLAVDLVVAIPLNGHGLIKTVSPAKPLVIGTVDVGSAQTIRVALAVPPSVRQFLLTAGGTMLNVQGKLDLFAVTLPVSVSP